MTSAMRHTRRSYRPILAQNLSTDGVRRLITSYHDGNGAVVNDFKLQPGFLYTQVRAISARINQNYDGWPSTELKKYYRTFLGKPVFVNHQNFDPTRARGRVVAARYVESGDDKFVEVIQEIDAQRFPKLAKEIRDGGLDSVSMGVEAGFTKCSVCDNKATDMSDMCTHVKHHKGKYLPHAKTGKRTLVYENCYKLGFFELSYVFDPADETAVVSKVLVANKQARRIFAAVGRAGQSSDHPVGTPPEQYVTPFRGRGYSGEEVAAYRNLNSEKTGTGLWSLLAKEGPHRDRVIGHSDSVHMPGARFFVNPKGADRVEETQVKDVHAGIRGVLGPVPHSSEMLSAPSGITYDPKAGDKFFSHRSDRNIPVEGTEHVHLAPDGRAYAFGFENAQVGVPEGDKIEPFYREGGEIHPRYQQIGRDAMRRHAYGETKAPEEVDTLRNTDDGGEKTFHHYVESPKELRDPDMDKTIRKDLQQEDEGLDGSRRAEAVEDISPQDGNKKIVEPDTAHEDAIDDFLDWCDSINVVPDQDSLDDFSNAYGLNDYNYQAISDFLESESSNNETASNANQAVPHMSRRKMSTYRYAEEFGKDPYATEEEGYGDEGDYSEEVGEYEPGAPPHDHDSDGDMDYEGEGEDGGIEEIVQDFMSWCEQSGCGLDPQSLDEYAQEAQLDDADYQELSEIISDGGIGGEDDSMMGDGGDPMMSGGDSSMGGGDPSEMLENPMMMSRTSSYGNGKSRTSSQKKRRAERGSSMARDNLASRGQRVASNQRLHRFADTSGHFDSGPYDENNQGEQEEVFLSQTPGAESFTVPTPGDGTISNTENTLVARINASKNSLQRDLVALQRLQDYKVAGAHDFDGETILDPVNPYSGMPESDTSGGSFGPTPGHTPQHAASRQYYAADGGFPDATTVNPELSGTEDQGLRGDSFDEVQPDKVPTQPKDASLKAFAAFDSWLRNTTGRTASQHGNANFIRRQAARWAGGNGYPVEVLFPTLGNFLRQARRIEGSNMRRTAEDDQKLELAAPQVRTDVETPVSNVTGPDAQRSQPDLGDFGNNAGDGVADPDLSTGSQIFAPGEGLKESNRKADGVAAIRLAEAYIRAGLKPEGDKYNLVAQFQTMRHATVTDRTRLLEAVLRTAAFSRRVTAGSMSRGAAPRTSLPPGLMNGGSMSRSASVRRIAANDPSTDSDLFL